MRLAPVGGSDDQSHVSSCPFVSPDEAGGTGAVDQ
jgi:hypothetical protein